MERDKITSVKGMKKMKELDAMIGDISVKIATTLINRLKEDSQCEK